MRKFKSWLTGTTFAAAALLLPMAVLQPVSVASLRAAAGDLAAGACDDGSAHLVMGCASALL
ncbi:MAG TPA: hypothetical protein VF652_00985 [Allosphingosinicella sp.]|jgi:hypothetical protein